MPKFSVMFKADMEGVEKLVLATDARLNLKCTQPRGGEEFPNLWITQEDEMEIPNSRGTAHLIVKVGDKKHGTIKIENFANDFVYTGEDAGTFKKVCDLECRDLEPTAWEIASSDWIAYGADEKTRFEVEFEDNEFYDYDDNAGCEVSITELKGEFKRSK